MTPFKPQSHEDTKVSLLAVVPLWLKTYTWNLLIAIDQLGNALLAGDPDETISSRAAKENRKGKRWACVLCKILDFIDKDHCEKSIEKDEGETDIQW